MAQLVRQQDGHQRERKSQPVQQQQRTGLQQGEDVHVLIQIERTVALKTVREHHADNRRGQQRQHKQQAVQRQARS